MGKGQETKGIQLSQGTSLGTMVRLVCASMLVLLHVHPAYQHRIKCKAIASRLAAVSMQLPLGEKTTSAQRVSVKRGVVVPTARRPTADTRVKPKGDGEELGIKGILSEYGIIALLFHFSVWLSSLATVYTLLTFGMDLNNLPEPLDSLLAQSSNSDNLPAAAGFAGRASATLGIVEVIGPARLALTITATPRLSEYARQYAAVRSLESWAESSWNYVYSKVAGDKS